MDTSDLLKAIVKLEALHFFKRNSKKIRSNQQHTEKPTYDTIRHHRDMSRNTPEGFHATMAFGESLDKKKERQERGRAGTPVPATSAFGLQNVTRRTGPTPPIMDTTVGMAAEMKEEREPLDINPMDSGDEASVTEDEAHNASIKDGLERIMGEMGVTSLDRRRAICQKVTDKVELYFAQQQEPVGRWLKGVEAFTVKHTKEIVEKYKHMKAKRESQVSTPAMSSIDIEITPRTIMR